ncbi:MAG: divergent PAP2 family protein [Patescibacteria group bacterium]|nr:MAG: divergent PAP2 family protein [Patescibacteria group bacterium]
MSLIYLLVPLAAVLIAQVSKFFIKNNNLKLNWKNLMAYSGMPSSHAAITTSLATIIGLGEGIGSPIFAVAVLLALLSIRDAVGIRQYIGKQGEVINELVEDLEEDNLVDNQYPTLLEKVGHTPKQLIAGTILGIAVGILGGFFI